MKLAQRIATVHAAEAALATRRNELAAHWTTLGERGRELFSPGRIVLAGLLLGWLAGRSAPLSKLAAGQQLLNLLGSVSQLFANLGLKAAAAAADSAANEAARPDDATPDATAAAAHAAPDAERAVP